MTKIINHRTRFVNSGFVLPTVTMVMLVVVLLSIAILLRSFDRAEVARNVRVDQATLAAATPALDRAKAKIDQLFNDSALPRSTPRDKAIYDVIGENSDTRYRFGDEIPLKIAFDSNGGGIQANDDSGDPDDLRLEDNEETRTAWMFPVDTDNNGQFDTYTLYSILFRSPSRNDDGEFDRTRSPLEARTPPMPDVATISEKCKNAFGTASGIVGDSDWYKGSSNLTKSFFVYTTNVPITQEQLATLNTNDYEVGKAGVSALEYQQDRLRIPLNNNAVWFEEDLELGLVSNFRLNGRVLTNGNFMPRAGFNGPITFYQVSDPESCFYEAENGKIIVGGNVADGDITDSVAKEGGRKEVFIHKYKQGAEPIKDDEINGDNKTTTSVGGSEVGYDINAYNERIGGMVDDALATVPTAPGDEKCSNCGALPVAVQEQYKERADVGEDNRELLEDVLESYYKSITRRVPFAEGTTNDGATMTGYDPPDEWIDIADNGLTIKETGSLAFLPTSDPELANNEEEEKLIGDRISVGYGLAALDLDGNETTEDFGNGIFWNDPDAANLEITASSNSRTRESQIDSLPDLGATERGLFWEKEAAKVPEAFDNSGGLRVVTGAGIYLAEDPDPNNWQKENVWSDAMPVPLEPNTLTTPGDDAVRSDVVLDGANPAFIPFLRMRATAVYHYTTGGSTPSPNTDQTPIACVSSYYDPTDITSALNQDGLPWNDDLDGRSNNGIVYNYVAVSESDPRLTVQADLQYPNGRYVNQPLRTALDTPAGDRLLQHYSAIHAAQCALNILDAPTSFSTAIPHGAIREAAFLDAREVKSLNRLSTDDTLPEWLQIAELENLQPSAASFPVATPVRYNLPLEQRQPLEVRVTEIDLSQLRESGATIGTGEYLLPNSGVIYATRDDALPDVSAVDASGDINDPGVKEELLSTSDFQLDPSRRPSGIRLINGTNLSRTNANDGDVAVEKGLILASNLPVYIKASDENGLYGFNLHKKPGDSTRREEFDEQLDGATWNNFYTRGDTDFNSAFACRDGQDGCTDSGDQWRPASILADSITLLSSDWEDGYRNQGDYDLRNNLGNAAAAAFLENGFLFNNFVTSSQWADASGWPNTTAPDNYMTSYLANGVTPIQRRVDDFPEYLMEVCTKLPVSECGPGDWYVDPVPGSSLTATGSLNQPFALSTDPATPDAIGSNVHKAGTTAAPAYDSDTTDSDPELTQYARRIAFMRNAGSNDLVLSGGFPIPIGIDSSGNIACYTYSGTSGSCQAFSSSNQPRTANESLWFQTTSTPTTPYLKPGSGGTVATVTYSANQPLLLFAPIDPLNLTDQPLLVPMLQIHSPTGEPGGNDNTVFGNKSNKGNTTQEKWLQVAAEGIDPTNTRQTIYNITFVSRNSPSRPEADRAGNTQPEETGGGLHNFIRTLENWGDNDPNSSHEKRTITISGNFIQSGQSTYATAPIQPTDKTGNTEAGLFYSLDGGDKAIYRYNNNDKGFPYRGGAFSQRSPFYWPADRAWGFDVGLLSQTPDLFAQRFTGEPVDDPDEYFREISSDDDWVRVLLCAKRQDNDQPALAGYVRPSDWCTNNSYEE
ncbi:MAG: hypothetical protein F6K01_31470 [Okeania sp. SIO1I7]|nr:hypothetical protein [Okeania sp. SIO1I7]